MIHIKTILILSCMKEKVKTFLVFSFFVFINSLKNRKLARKNQRQSPVILTSKLFIVSLDKFLQRCFRIGMTRSMQLGINRTISIAAMRQKPLVTIVTSRSRRFVVFDHFFFSSSVCYWRQSISREANSRQLTLARKV